MDQDRPNQPAKNEPAEGARETDRTNETGRDNETSRDNQRTIGENAGGITNRPLDREQQEQSEVPPRGQTKDEERNA